MKSLGRELASIGLTLAIPAAVACLFPYHAVRFSASDGPAADPPAAAFVVLTTEEESAATRAAKASWQSSREDAPVVRSDLSFGELPPSREQPVLDVDSRTRMPPPADLAWQAPPFMPRPAAPPVPPMDSKEREPAEPTFSRADMTKPPALGMGAR